MGRRASRLDYVRSTPESGGDGKGTEDACVEHVFFELEFVEGGEVHSRLIKLISINENNKITSLTILI